MPQTLVGLEPSQWHPEVKNMRPKYFREEYDSMSAAQCQQLCELPKKAGLIKGRKTPESSTALEARVAGLEAKSENSSNESLFTDMKPTAIEIIQTLIERETAPDRAIQMPDG